MGDDRSLRRAIEVLREPDSVSPEWLAALEEKVAGELPGRLAHAIARPPAWPPHRLSLRPFVAVAAAFAFMVAGGAVTAAWMAGRNVAPRQAAAEVTPPGSERGHAVTVRFMLVAPSAVHVSVVGDFNGWNPVATPMRRTQGDRWIVALPLQPGRHAYAFYVDGDVLADPAAPREREEDFGVPNSLVLVNGSP